jgi:hypothetical protein
MFNFFLELQAAIIAGLEPNGSAGGFTESSWAVYTYFQEALEKLFTSHEALEQLKPTTVRSF